MNKTLLPAVTAILAPLGAAFAQAPANDAFAAAEVIAAPGVVSGSNANATSQTGEPAPHLQNANVTGTAPRTVWYTWTPAESGLASISVVAQGTGTAAGILHAVAYTGSAVNGLTRLGATTSSAGAAGPPATAGTGRAGNFFAVTAGTPVHIQVSGNSGTASAPFDLTVRMERPGKVVLPMYATWDWLHPINGEDPTTDAQWAATWKVPGDTTSYNGNPALSFTSSRPGPFGFGGVDLAPGTITNIGTAAAAVNNAAYFRTTFTLDSDTSNLWAQILADDGAWIYIDDLPGIPVRIAATLTNTSFTTSTAHNGWRPQPDTHLTGAIPAASANAPVPGCRAYTRTGFDNEKQVQAVFLGGLTGKLSAGTHRIAVSLHQTGTTSSDMGFGLTLLDLAPRALPPTGAAITFNDVAWVNGSATATVIPVAEHHYAPNSSDGDLAWYLVSPATRGTVPLSGGCVVSETLDGTAQRVLRLRDAEARRFVTEPVSVAGLTQFTAALRVRTNDTTSGFEAPDTLRIFVETSTDGVNFSEPAPAAELLPSTSGPDLLTAFQDRWVQLSSLVPTSGATAARLVIEGGTDSTNETIWFDDVVISSCLVSPTVTNVLYNNNGDDDRSNDTVSFTLSVAGTGTTAPNWVTNGFGAGSEVTSTFGAGGAVTVTRPAADVAGVRQNVVFRVEEQGNSNCFANVTVTTPAAALATTFAPTNFTRQLGADPLSPTDDTFTFTLDPTGTALGATYQVRSTDTGNTVLYATGTYGTPANITVPVNTASITVIDQSVTTVTRTIALSAIGAPIAMGRNLLGGSRAVYSVPGAVAPIWRQAAAPAAGDTEFTTDDFTGVFNLNRAPVAGEGLLESESISTAGFANVGIRVTLRAFESSTGSGFETNDTFKLAVELTRPGGTERVDLVTGHPADKSPADGQLNGFTAATAAEYTTGAASDEFNAALATAAQSSRGTFSFLYSVPADVTAVRLIADATSNSNAEFFFLKDFVIEANVSSDSDGDGMPDTWEIANFGSLAQTGTGDVDGDGQSNAAEFAAGTDPNLASSALVITQVFIDRAANSATIDWASVVGKTYRVQRATSLEAGAAWTDIGAPVTANGVVSVFTDDALPAGERWFYRVRVSNP